MIFREYDGGLFSIIAQTPISTVSFYPLFLPLAVS